jgi:type II secretory pathway pseudopilin PulG
MNANLHKQQGATLIIALVMLVMITLIVVGAMSLSMTNLKVAGNTQFRAEAMSAGNLAIQQYVSAQRTATPANDFTILTPPTTDPVYPVDINQDGATDFNVTVHAACISRRVLQNNQLTISSDPRIDESGCFTGSSGVGTASLCSLTTWDVAATVIEYSLFSGVALVVHQGISKILPTSIAATTCS